MKFEQPPMQPPVQRKEETEGKRYIIQTEKGGKITLTEEEYKSHQETLRKQKVLQHKEGEKAVKQLEEFMKKNLGEEGEEEEKAA